LGSRKKRKNGNDNENNGQVFKIGTCMICERENVPLTEHHIYKKAVYGESDRKFMLCRDCHDVLEFINRTWENMVLRPFIRCYRQIFNAFLKGEINGFPIDLFKKIDERELINALMPIILKEFKRIENKGVNPWLSERIATKGISVKARKKNENYGR